MAAAPTPYDELPYEAEPVSFTAPEHLSITSWLAGGPRPRTESFRYLEVGCADGTNLLALAFYHPESEFVGVDASEVQVAAGRAAAARLGLANLRFETADLRALPPSLAEPFDYIAAHGLFSWMPEDARRALLALARERLTPDGVAYVSYNVFPGWKLRGLVREIALRAAGEGSLPARAARSRAAAQALAAALPVDDDAWALLLRRELETVARSRDFYLVHEYLSEFNDPLWFRDFVALAEAAGLAYISDAMTLRQARARTESIYRALEAQAEEGAPIDRIDLEQRADILCDRAFRASLLCRAEAPRGPAPGIDAVKAVYVAGLLLPPDDPPRFADGEAEVFRAGDTLEMRTSDPLMKAALREMAERYPTGLKFDALVEIALARLEKEGAPFVPGPGDVDELAEGLLMLDRYGHIELRPREPRMRVDPGPRPTMHALARHEAALRPRLTSPVHHLLNLQPIDQHIVPLLDGAHDPDWIVADIARRGAGGELSIAVDGTPSKDEAAIAAAVRERMDELLRTLSAWGLFVAGAPADRAG